jgi:hypothetical protein
MSPKLKIKNEWKWMSLKEKISKEHKFWFKFIKNRIHFQFIFVEIDLIINNVVYWGQNLQNKKLYWLQ